MAREVWKKIIFYYRRSGRRHSGWYCPFYGVCRCIDWNAGYGAPCSVSSA